MDSEAKKQVFFSYSKKILFFLYSEFRDRFGISGKLTSNAYESKNMQEESL